MSWRSHHRGLLAIHAAQTHKYDSLATSQPYLSALMNASIDPDKLPHGAIVAIVNVFSIHEIHMIHHHPVVGGFQIGGDEVHFGVWAMGRFAWRLTNVRRLVEPIQISGQRRLWKWKAPLGLDSLLAGPEPVQNG